MARKKVVKKKKLHPIKRNRNFTGRYLRIYILSLCTAIVVFVVGSLFVRPGEPCANSKTCQSDLTEQIDNTSTGIFQGQTVIPPKIDFAYESTRPTVLGDTTPESEKHIYVDLSTQKLYAYEGGNLFMETFIASGRWGKTPVGNFNIWTKLRATRMSGGEGADYYNLPNVPYTMYFYNDFGLHGAYWHNNFGHTMSHGCVNMRIVDAHKLFDWADGPAKGQKGTAVSICKSFTQPNTCVQD